MFKIIRQFRKKVFWLGFSFSEKPLRVFIKLALVTCILTWSLAAQGTDHYVRPIATGSANGTNWNNAWSIQGINWAALSSGDTVYLAGGIYTNALSVQANNINIDRVLTADSDATNAAGWSQSFDSTVIITNLNTSSNVVVGLLWNKAGKGNYVTIDGRVPGGIVCGVSEQATYNNSWLAAISAITEVPTTNVVFTNLEFVGPGLPHLANSIGMDVFGYVCHGMRITHCRIHDEVVGIQIGQGIINGMIDHCFFYNIASSPTNGTTQHNNVVYAGGCSDMVFADNIVSNWETEGILLNILTNGSWDIYNNLFVDGDTNGQYPRIYEQKTNAGPISFHNNTCENCNFGATFSVYAGTFTGWVTNNIFFNCQLIQCSNSDYNLFSGAANSYGKETHSVTNATSAIFVNYAANDFHIVGTVGTNYPAQKGVNLGSTYSADFAGTAIPSVGAWDIGAYQSTDTVTSAPINAPSNLNVIRL